MAIPSEFIDEVLARTDIVALIREYVTLVQKGSEFKGLCPFHGEKTPSFSVSQEKNVYHCFGCNAGGGAVNFVMEAEGLEYIEAIEFLANRAGLTMPENSYDNGQSRALQEKILQLNRITARFYHSCLQEPTGGEAMAYLQGRGLSPQILTRFGLGFAPNDWDALIRHCQGLGYQDHDLLQAGLASQSKTTGKILDRFRNRIMFPIINVKKEVIGFGGRIMDDSQPKYLNSPDTPVFNKSKNLYGLNMAKKTKGSGILVEGYMDTIALHQEGFEGAVASLGTAFTEGQAMLLKRYFKNMILAYDGDQAGQAATERAIPILNKVALEARVLQMSGAKDPDEFIKKYGATSFTHLLNQSMHHIDYKLALMKSRFNLEDNNQRVHFLQETARYLGSMDSPIQREIYATKVGEWVSVSKDAVLMEIDKEIQQKKNKSKRQLERRAMNPASNVHQRSLYDVSRASRAEETLLCACLLEQSYFSEFQDFTAEEFSVPFLGKVFALLKERFLSQGGVEISFLTPYLTQEEMGHLVSLYNQPQERENLPQAVAESIDTMEKEYEIRALQGTDKLLALQKQMLERQERL